MPQHSKIHDKIYRFIVGEISDITSLKASSFNEGSSLFGSTAAIKSRELVELLLAVEDFMMDTFNQEFDWTNDSAFSERTSIFRTIGSLTDHLTSLTQENNA